MSSDNGNSNIRPPFPPTITFQDLIPTTNAKVPNAFIVYRMALSRELKLQNLSCDRSRISSIASRLWSEEPEDVKNAYRQLVADAQLAHNQSRGFKFLSYNLTEDATEELDGNEISTWVDPILQQGSSSTLTSFPAVTGLDPLGVTSSGDPNKDILQQMDLLKEAWQNQLQQIDLLKGAWQQQLQQIDLLKQAWQQQIHQMDLIKEAWHNILKGPSDQ